MSQLDDRPQAGRTARTAPRVSRALRPRRRDALAVQLPDSTVLRRAALGGLVVWRRRDAGFEQFLQQLAQSSTGSGSLGVNALA